jgi:hypothetical protein
MADTVQGAAGEGEAVGGMLNEVANEGEALGDVLLLPLLLLVEFVAGGEIKA